MVLRKITLLTLAFAAFGCSNDSPDDLGVEAILTDTPITYNANVKAIIDNNCISCHSTIPQNGAPMSLATFEDVKSAIELRGLIERISKDNGQSGLMPLGGPKMPQQNIDMITLWRDQEFQH
ncbi:hypothetical protein FNO01nite_27120 [Flavobacterium noncentrifugens]|uniref:Cytochrome c domain-containing protein n=1 Tax=Flavobacterium noncentrifugens TaxID=1128970 RepID=A0A1G9CHQ0_9FLAO|nr:hypothetical protein [Flavobacterium noncentrifugens]GEP52040.1 hypothetical protein FNO01nite_27120 [Flavobacterium noncentrifugens]SDK51203.1 hypothetical protein SAMN04487935_3532 [Flavobacterium noncentrifugens]